MKLSGKKVLLGICGSIAAYKAAELIRLLVKSGAEVKVIMTEAASAFVTPLTFSTLSKNDVFIEFADEKTGSWNNHVELGLWADLFIIAPATANTMSKCANGSCDNLLTAVYLSAKCPVWIAPAMDHDMYLHQTTQDNISKLRSLDIRIIDPAEGELASGLHGEGRMQEPSYLFKLISSYLETDKSKLSGKKILITAGPTREAIDPVRFISNHSSGKMGMALLKEMIERGADVTLVHGPGVNVNSLKNKECQLIAVTSAEDMYQSVSDRSQDYDIIIMAAAVADYTPVQSSDVKLKKSDQLNELNLVATKDILLELGKNKKENQVVVGFALETNNEVENAMSKLERKNLDLIILNSLNDEGAGFNTDTNKVTIIDKNKNITKYTLKEKSVVASDIADKIELFI